MLIKNRKFLISEAQVLYCFAFAVIMFTMFARFFYCGDGYLSAFDDDFYYYLKIAQNIVGKGISSFDGIHISNGYHPLWMLIVVSVLKLFGGGILFFIAISLIISLLNLLIFIYSLKICRNFFGNTKICYLLSLISLIFSLQLTRSGMEISITILMIYVMIDFILLNKTSIYKPSSIIKLGFISSIIFLSRLDSIFFILFFIVGLIDIKHAGLSVKRISFFSIGFVLVLLYLIFNYSNFGEFMPISGQAKHLKSGFMPSINAISSLVALRPQRLFIVPSLALSLFALIIIYADKKSDRIVKKFIFYPVLLFGFVHIGFLSLVSDWRVWSWYAYPYVSSLMVSSIIIILFLKDKIYLKRHADVFNKLLIVFIFVIGSYAVLSVIRFMQYVPAKNSIYQASIAISGFEKSHHGIYAMGDRAGTVGFMIDSPLIQLEGLVMDKKFLENIKSYRDLIDTLESYNVDYYISTNPKVEDGKFIFYEPAQALGTSFKMRGELCYPPLFEFNNGGVHTAVFKIYKPSGNFKK